MCGICGIVAFDGAGDEQRDTVRRMVSLLRHRGPDGCAQWDDGTAVLGHARLAIIDLAGGHQPMFNEHGTVAVVFNGEIYNFQSLHTELEARGHRFTTRSDTEVIVHGYEEWGDAIVERLRGMFALAIWDVARKRLTFARDRFGEKPLYYYGSRDGRAIAFASEIKALFADPGVPRELNQSKVSEYLAFRCVAGDETLFRGLRQLEPGSIMILEGGTPRVRRYWSPVVPVANNGEPSRKQLEELLYDAVDCRLVSDVPLGTITSGGIDSSLVTAMAIRAAGNPLASFCVGFDDPTFDERPFAREVATAVGSTHHELAVSPSDVEGELDRLTWAHDEPLTHPNAIPMHLIFRFAKERAGVTVVLSGEGADELFGGYGWYSAARRLEDIRWLAPFRHVIPRAARGRMGVLRKVLDPAYPLVANAVLDREMVERLSGDTSRLVESRRAFWPPAFAPTDALFRYDQLVYLPPLLQRQDRMSMAAGVEARVVFLDHALAETVNAIPAAAKLRGGVRKALLRDVAAGWIPERIISRPKVGFTLPLGAWMRGRGPLADRVHALGDASGFSRALIPAATLSRIASEHESGARDHADVLWSLVALDSWAATYLGPEVRSATLPGAATGRVLPSPAPVSQSSAQ
jgi:asparagine synthase (glutamine-hydrolysing)